MIYLPAMNSAAFQIAGSIARWVGGAPNRLLIEVFEGEEDNAS